MSAEYPTPGPAGAQGDPGQQGPPGGSTHTQKTYALFAAGVSDYWSAPDAAALDITGTIDLRALILPTSWFPAAQKIIFGKWVISGNQRSYMFSLQKVGALAGLLFQASPNGTSVISIASSTGFSVAAPSTSPIWVRCVAIPNDGTGKSQATFYYSLDDQASWIQLGVPVTNAVPGPWFSGSGDLRIGNTPSNLPFTGRIYKAHVYDNVTRVATFDATNLSSVAAFTDSDGRTWTPAATAAIASDSYTGDQDVLSGSLRYGVLHDVPPSGGGVNLDLAASLVLDGATDAAVPLNTALLAIPHGTGFLSNHSPAYILKHPVIIPNGVRLVGQSSMQGGSTLQAHSSFPHTTISGAQTTASDTLTDFTLTVASTANFPLGVGGITPPAGVGVLCVAGITIFYTGATPTTFTGCRVGAGDVSVSLANGRAVSTFMVWLTDPSDANGGFGTRLERVTVDCNSIAGISAVHTCHIQEGGGWDDVIFTKFANFGFRLDDNPLQPGLVQGTAEHSTNYECRKAWVIFSSVAEAEAVGIDIMHSFLAQTAGPKLDSDRGIKDTTVVVQGNVNVVGKAAMRLNGATGTYDDHHFENMHAGLIIGDKYRCDVGVRNIAIGSAWGSGSDDAGVLLGSIAGTSADLRNIRKANASNLLTRKILKDLLNGVTLTDESRDYRLYQDGRYRIDGGGAKAASRPSASAVPVGADFYDAATGPQWSDGSNWRKADGTIV